jgi:RecA-family ATPase
MNERHKSAVDEIINAASAPLAPLLYAYKPRPWSQIPRRPWLHAKHYIRQMVVMTVAPGAWGKSSLLIVNALEMVLHRGLIGPRPVAPGPLRVGYWNAEDPEDETERRRQTVSRPQVRRWSPAGAC